jgi:pimeloyl-ACP methyl ester carboxylesterase
MANTPEESIHLPTTDGAEPSHLAVRYAAPAGDASRGGEPPVAVLYLHGFGSRQGGTKAEFFRRRFVEAGLAFCSFDFQGHGDSGGSMLGLSLSRNLDDTARVHDWLEARGHRRVVLAGSSMGGLTALWHGARHPGRALAATHLAPALDLGRNFEERVGEAGMRQWRREGRLHVQNDLVDCHLGWNFVEDFAVYPVDRLQAQYRTPTLLLQGKQDDSVNWRSVAAFATACSPETVRLHLFTDGDHRLIEHRERLWALMREFLEGRGVFVGSPCTERRA